MKSLNLNTRTVNKVFNDAVKASNNINTLLTTALKYAVYFCLADGNGERGVQLYNDADIRFKSDISSYLVAHGYYTLHEGKPRMKKGLKMPQGAKELQAHKIKVMAQVMALPSINEFKKPKANKPAAKVIDAVKPLKSSLTRVKNSLKGVDLEDPAMLHNQKIVVAMDSYLENIEQGIDLEQAINIKERDIKAQINDALKSFENELLEGKTQRAKAFIAKLQKPAKTPVKTNIAKNVSIGHVGQLAS